MLFLAVKTQKQQIFVFQREDKEMEEREKGEKERKINGPFADLLSKKM